MVRLTQVGLLIACLGAVLVIFNLFGWAIAGLVLAAVGAVLAARGGLGHGWYCRRRGRRGSGDPVPPHRRGLGDPRRLAGRDRACLAILSARRSATRALPKSPSSLSRAVYLDVQLDPGGLLLALDRDLELQRQVVVDRLLLHAEEHERRVRRAERRRRVRRRAPARPAGSAGRSRGRSRRPGSCRAAGTRCPACRRPSWSRGGW